MGYVSGGQFDTHIVRKTATDAQLEITFFRAAKIFAVSSAVASQRKGRSDFKLIWKREVKPHTAVTIYSLVGRNGEADYGLAVPEMLAAEPILGSVY